MYKLGDIILIPFPFTDLSNTKVRPALIISKNNQKSQNVIVCFITSNQRQTQNDVKIENIPETGLKTPSVIRLDKIATIDKKIILGELGKVNENFFTENKQKFFNIFGF